MFDEKWRLLISDETWEFENLEELKRVLLNILDYKNKYGQLKKKEEIIVGCNCCSDDEESQI
jgi:hypothetical protein